MKKQMIMITMMSAAICLTGCGGELNMTASQPGAAPENTAETTTAATQTASEVSNGTNAAAPADTASGNSAAASESIVNADAASAENTENAPVDAPDISAIAGDWYYQEQDPQNGEVYSDAGFVTVQANGSYTYQPGNGSASKNGTIKVEYDEYSNGAKVPFFAFYENGSTFWIGAYCQQNDPDIYYIGNGGITRLSRRQADANPYEDYIGTWQCDRCTIQIGQYGLVEIHWADSASEDNVWEYACIYSEDNTHMECLGGGTKTHIVTAEDGTETQEVVYSDGTASFTYKNGVLTWSDGKESAGMGMGFKKIG